MKPGRRPPRSRSVGAKPAGPAPPRWLVPSAIGLSTAAAILVRWWFVLAWDEAGSASSVFYHGDAQAFLAFARAIAAGEPFDNGIPFHPPGWPAFLSTLVTVGMNVAALKLGTACLSGLTVGLTALLACRLAGRGAMLAVALLGTFHFGHIVAGTVLVSESLYGLLLVAALLVTDRWVARGSVVWAMAAGTLAALAATVRAEFLLGAGLIAGVAWWLRGRAASREVALFAAAFLLTLAPPTIVHWRSLSAFNAAHQTGFPGPLPRLAPVTSYGAFNFAMANHDDADGGPNRDHPMLDACSAEAGAEMDRGNLELACPAAYDLYVHGYGIGARWLLAHPADAAALWRRKLEMTVGVFAHGYLFDNLGAGVDGERRRVDLLDPAGRALVPLHLLLLAGGIAALRPRPDALAMLAAPAVTLAAATVLFYGYVRLAVPYLPIVWILQGAACAWACGRLLPPAAHRRAPAIAVVAAVLLLAYAAIEVGARRAVTLDGPRLPDGALMLDETLTVRRAR